MVQGALNYVCNIQLSYAGVNRNNIHAQYDISDTVISEREKLHEIMGRILADMFGYVHAGLLQP